MAVSDDTQSAGYRAGDEDFARMAAEIKQRRQAEQKWMDEQPIDPVFAYEPVNWNLLQTMYGKSHPVMVEGFRVKAEKAAAAMGLAEYAIGEMICEHLASHHLLDMIGVPCPLPSVGGAGHPADLEVRVWRAVVGVTTLRERLDRIATWHSRETAPGGMVGDYCNECGHVWPCDTYKMANGDWTDADDEDLADVLGVGEASDG